MNDTQWDGLCHLIGHWFKGELPDDKANAYGMLLKRYELNEVSDAMMVLLERGQTWLPSVGEIVAAINAAKAAAAPDFTTVMRYLKRVGRHPNDHEFVRWLERECHPVVAAWANDFGVHRIRTEEVDDPKWGGSILKRWQQSYEKYVAHGRTNDQMQRALNGHAPEGLKRLNPAASLALVPTNTGELLASAPQALPPGQPDALNFDL